MLILLVYLDPYPPVVYVEWSLKCNMTIVVHRVPSTRHGGGEGEGEEGLT